MIPICPDPSSANGNISRGASMKCKIPVLESSGRLDLQSVFSEINRLRRRDGLEDVGGLGLAIKLFSHFHESENPRVAEALRNLERKDAAPLQGTAPQ